jgi:hypothetical protein
MRFKLLFLLVLLCFVEQIYSFGLPGKYDFELDKVKWFLITKYILKINLFKQNRALIITLFQTEDFTIVPK